MKTLMLLAMMLIPSVIMAEDVWVDGYTKSNGTYVNGHYRSRPNAYQWDNKSYEPSQPQYNDSYYDNSKSRSSSYYTPSETRFNDDNPYNDSPSYNSYQEKSKSTNNIYDYLNR